MARNYIKDYQNSGKIGEGPVPSHMMDFYTAGLERMKELYETDPNHRYHIVNIDEDGRRIKPKNQKSDIEQNLSFEKWLETPTGKAHIIELVDNYSDAFNLFSTESTTKTKRSGKTVELSREITPKEKEVYIKNIMSSDEPTRMWSPSEPRYTKTVTTPQYRWEGKEEDKETVSPTAEVEPLVKEKPIRSRPGKIARWTKRDEEEEGQEEMAEGGIIVEDEDAPPAETKEQRQARRKRNRKARRQKKGKRQKGASHCYKGKYAMICPGDEGYDESMVTT